MITSARDSLVVVVAVALVACSGSESGTGSGGPSNAGSGGTTGANPFGSAGAGNPFATGGATAAGGNATGAGNTTGSTLADGSIGSSCTGTCAAGLTCGTEAQGLPGGYCSKQCASEADCGASAHCYAVMTSGGTLDVCLRSCQADPDCRAGYSCQGTAPNGVCYPATTGAGGGATTGSCDMAYLTGGWWQYTHGGGSLSQVRFYPDGTAEYDIANMLGDASYAGQWQLACPNLTATFESMDKPSQWVMQGNYLYENGDPNSVWERCQEISNGKCF